MILIKDNNCNRSITHHVSYYEAHNLNKTCSIRIINTFSRHLNHEFSVH